MNRERLKILRDHLDGLPDEQFDISDYAYVNQCGTVACIAGWATQLFAPERGLEVDRASAAFLLGLNNRQSGYLFFPSGFIGGDRTRTDAIAAIDSMLASPDDDALPVWPEKAVAA